MNGAQSGVAQGAQGAFPQGGNFAGRPPGMGGRGALNFLPGGPYASIIILALFVITLIVLAVAFWQIFRKTGYSGALGLLMLVPVVNLGVALWLAFAEWPLLAELQRLKMVAAFAPPAGGEAPAVPAATQAAEQAATSGA